MDWRKASREVRESHGVRGYEPLEPFVAQRTLDRAIWAERTLTVFYAHGDAVNNSCCVWEGIIPEGMGPPPHLHLYKHEVFYLLEGRLDVWIEGIKYDAPKGAMVFIPAGRAHWFISVASETRMFAFTFTADKSFPDTHKFKQLFEFLGMPAEAMMLPDRPCEKQRPDPQTLMRLNEEDGSHTFQVAPEIWRPDYGGKSQVSVTTDK